MSPRAHPAYPTWFRAYLARYRREVACALALGLLAAGCAALLMFTSGYLISATALAGTTLFSILVPVGCVQLFGFGRPLARYLERLASHDWVLRVTSDLRVALFRGIERRIGDPAREQAAGEYLSMLADDVAHLQNLYLRVVFPSCIAYLLAIGAALLFGFFSIGFALAIALSFAITTVAIPAFSLLATRALASKAKTFANDEYATLADDVYGSVDWVLAGRGDDARIRHRKNHERMVALGARVRMAERAFSLVSTVLLAIVAGIVVAWAGMAFTQPGANVNWIAAFALGFFPLIESFAVLPAAYSESTAHVDALARLDRYLSEESDGHPENPPVLTPSPGDSPAIALENARYTYPGAKKPAIRGLSLEIARGESVAVLGKSGAGKSTLAKLVCAALPLDEGRLAVCGNEIATRPADLSSLVGYLDQTPYLFNRSLRDNITLGIRAVDDTRLAALLADVGLADKLASLDGGLDAVIGETGVGLSGGEAHRVALARVLAADTPVVVVDEPFSALDPETERDLLDTLLETCRDKTLVVVTHHLAQIERFDRVIFIEDGQVDLDGSPAALMRESERFRTLVAFDR